MYDCPNCGGNLRFDIPLQQLHCDYCGTNMDPYSYEKKKDAVESQFFETTVYTCPQCGGEIMTTNVSATGFCTYCGASTILDSRIRNEKRPAKIIPFQKSKEDCKKAFTAMMRRSLYAPKQLKSPDYLEQFRGIYIPYWMYDFRIGGIRGMRGSTSARKGNYIITKHYSLSCDMDTAYDGVAFDASSSLDDSLSESIAPFDPGAAKDFTPSFLCGFYADTSDVPAETYTGDAFSLIAEDIVERAKKQIFPGNGAETPGDPARVLQYKGSEPACAMFPVWFLTYRHKDRVAYAVMNGQTGKISSDLPIVEGKYLAGSIILAVPLFFLFNAVLTVTAPTALLLTMIPAALSGFALLSEIRAQMAMESHEGDKGYEAAIRIAPGVNVQNTAAAAVQVQEAPATAAQEQQAPATTAQEQQAPAAAAQEQEAAYGTAQSQDAAYGTPQTQEGSAETLQTADTQILETADDPAPAQEAHAEAAQTQEAHATALHAAAAQNPTAAPQTPATGRKKDSKKSSSDKKNKNKKNKKPKKSLSSIAILIAIYVVGAVVQSLDSVLDGLPFILTLVPVLLGISLVVKAVNLHRERGGGNSGVFPGIIGAILSLVISEMVTIFHPVSDLYYYGAAIASILCTVFTLTAIVRRYNLMATRPLPSFFDRKGGDTRG